MISSLEVMLTTKVNAAVIEHGERNVEDIRRRNLEDNQLFLKQLLMFNVSAEVDCSTNIAVRLDPRRFPRRCAFSRSKKA